MRSLRSHRSNPEPPTTLTVPARNAHIETFARPTSRAESRRSPSPVTGRLWASGSRSPSPEVTREATSPDEVPEEVSGTPINKSRAQPPTTGQHVGLCAARKAQKEAEREQEELHAQREAGLETRRLTRVAISLLATDKNITPNVRRETAQNLQSHITGALADISEVAKVPGWPQYQHTAPHRDGRERRVSPAAFPSDPAFCNPSPCDSSPSGSAFYQIVFARPQT
ncbi:hypothetical protein K1T71_014946 [Dendrolimus kikuchii]|nr:hypothetical protein K1T71_014946 [Dendrolimus kikuchii]